MNRSVVVIDSGFTDPSVKRTKFVLKLINSNIKLYSAMFFATPFAKEKLDYFFGKDNQENKFLISSVEDPPKHTGKLL